MGLGARRARALHREYRALPSKPLSLVIFLFVIFLAAAANLGLEPQVHQGLQNDDILTPSLFISWSISVKPNFLYYLITQWYHSCRKNRINIRVFLPLFVFHVMS